MAEQHAYHPNQELHQHVHESKLSAVYTKISSLSYQQGEVSVTKKTESMSVTYNNGALKSQNHKDPTWSYCSHV